MTNIFFYHGATHRISAATTLITKACAQRKPILVYASQEITNTLSRALWTQNPTSFIPHTPIDSPLAGETPVLLTWTLEHPTLPNERLMNLTDNIPNDFFRFTSLIEVVAHDANKAAARERFKFYKEQGYPITSVDLTGKP